jgi:hypothetical protein
MDRQFAASELSSLSGRRSVQFGLLPRYQPVAQVGSFVADNLIVTCRWLATTASWTRPAYHQSIQTRKKPLQVCPSGLQQHVEALHAPQTNDSGDQRDHGVSGIV